MLSFCVENITYCFTSLQAVKDAAKWVVDSSCAKWMIDTHTAACEFLSYLESIQSDNKNGEL